MNNKGLCIIEVYKTYKALVSHQSQMKIVGEQVAVVTACLNGRNVFVTGSAGVGKSYTLKQIRDALMEKTGGRVVVTSPTGLAAILVGGCTVYAAFSIHPDMVKKMDLQVRKFWTEIDVLIIDEISMLDPTLFHYLDQQARKSRNAQDLPFGGVQLILIGDFFQLPPVHKAIVEVEFVFETETWCSLNILTMELQTVHRQKDEKFIGILERIRRGTHTSEDTTVINNLTPSFRKRKRVPETPNTPNKKPRGKDEVVDVIEAKEDKQEIKATKLYCRNIDVTNENLRELSKIHGDSMEYDIIFKVNTTGKKLNADQISKLRAVTVKNSSLVERFKVKIGAQVMLTANLSISAGLANGARGVVVDFDADDWPIVRFCNIERCVIKPYLWEIQVGRKQTAILFGVPLKLAWAMTIHKSQGQSIDYMEADLRDAFAAGQVYTALSRAKTLEGLTVRNFDPKKVKAHPKVLKFYESIRT
jgi:ATP-dependent DNA helicase PIF1